MKRYVLLDRDGTITIDRGYLKDPDELEFLPGAVEGLRRMRAVGLGLIVTTNQSGIGRGIFDLERLQRIHDRLRHDVRSHGVDIDGIYTCPHRPDEGCCCRKPRTGLALRAQADFGFRFNDCIVIGDRQCDWEFGRRINALTIGIASEALTDSVIPDIHVRNLIEASEAISSRFCHQRHV